MEEEKYINNQKIKKNEKIEKETEKTKIRKKARKSLMRTIHMDI